MKKFLKTLLIFSLPIALLVAFAILAGVWEWRCFMASITSEETVIGAIGNSHCHYAIADTEFPGMMNFGLRATPTPFWLAKARLVVKKNPRMRIMLVDVYPDVLFEESDDNIARLNFVRNFHPQTIVMDFMCRKDMCPFDMRRLSYRCWHGIILPYVCRIFSGSTYSRLHERWYVVDKYLKDFDPTKIPTNPVNEGRLPRNHTRAWFDVDELCSMLSSSGVKPILITVPLPKSHRNRISEDQWQCFKVLAKEIADRHNTIWKDYSCEFEEDENYCDCFHMNKAGALKFTKRLLDDYTNGILSQ